MTEGQSVPGIDVVIPALNSARQLNQCLRSVLSQTYPGPIHVLVVDGGSTDGTQEVARSFGAELLVNPGQYATGLTGARHAGEKRGSSELVWLLDSDNIVMGSNVAAQLAEPLVSDPEVQLSVPLLDVESHNPSFNRWLARVEQAALEVEAKAGHRQAHWVRVDALTHGISNGTLIRRKALAAVGGYDSDVRLLQRLRSHGLAKAAIVERARIVHEQVSSLEDFVRKATSRLRRFSEMTDSELSDYFVEYPVPATTEAELHRGLAGAVVERPLQAIGGYGRTGDPAWLWGLVYPFIVIGLALRHPWASWRVYNRFL